MYICNMRISITLSKVNLSEQTEKRLKKEVGSIKKK